MMQYRSTIEYGIIGLGRFGFALAKTLCEAGKEVLILDNNENKIKQIRSLTEDAFVVGQLDKEALLETGIQNCKTVIVCIGEKIDTSILTTLTVISMGVPRVIAKAISYEQGCVLEKIGAEVVYPESDMAVRLAKRLLTSNALDFMELDGDIKISEIKITSRMDGKTVLQADLRRKFGINIIALEQDHKTEIEVDPDCILKEGDEIVVIGKQNSIRKFENFLNN